MSKDFSAKSKNLIASKIFDETKQVLNQVVKYFIFNNLCINLERITTNGVTNHMIHFS